MNISALIFMIVTQALITGVTLYLYIKVLKKPNGK
ncbi:hypothetical protein AT05_02765 [Schleiferia thermophila str. Yellowstone]|jgi:uncharacterized membrane protein YheB (UPF0754 family)|uniref:Uncharacterized protein n=1 Tax=Schleiferia thermophila TaxID=884107 RepID=A0A369A3N5_9FLAO|nr:hypothetical protein AT05_02765 [Schleiferia thermophila str. Yellowstone]RCX03771.1 hypothetical protein DES35_102226 [Schleiferia thermophila]